MTKKFKAKLLREAVMVAATDDGILSSGLCKLLSYHLGEYSMYAYGEVMRENWPEVYNRKPESNYLGGWYWFQRCEEGWSDRILILLEAADELEKS